MKTDTKYVPLAVEPLLITAKQLAVLLNISESGVHNLDNSGKIPAARSLNTSRRWSVQEIRAWTNAGCPDRISWMQKQNNDKK